MQEHLKNVQQELVYTQSRCDSKGKEIESESHMKRLSDLAGRVTLEPALDRR
jgi:hypothetical protein